MENKEKKDKIILSDETQKSILQFFMKTSILRKAKQERIKDNSEKELKGNQ
jgi:hypothetical protein